MGDDLRALVGTGYSVIKGLTSVCLRLNAVGKNSLVSIANYTATVKILELIHEPSPAFF